MKPEKGMLDKYPETLEKEDLILDTFSKVCSLFALKKIKTPIIEKRSLYERSLGNSSDVVSKEMFKVGSGNRENETFDKLVLRPEGTAGAVRALINLKEPFPQKVFYMGSMFRKENPQKGRFREFTQGGIELLKINTLDLIQGILLSQKFLQDLGILNSVSLKINYLGSKKTQNKVKDFLQKELAKKQDELSLDSKERLSKNPLRILDSKSEVDQEIIKNIKFDYLSFLTPEEKACFDEIQDLLGQMKVSFKVDPLLVRGLDYYEDLVLEYQSEDIGSQSAVLAGGQYSSLVKELGGEKCSCFGFAFGLERIALITPDLPKKEKIALACIKIKKLDTLKILTNLRENEISVDLIEKNNLRKTMDYANKKSYSKVIIIGDDEIKNNTYTLKEMNTGVQKTLPFNELVKEIKGDGT